MEASESQANNILEAALDDAFSSPPKDTLQPDVLQSAAHDVPAVASPPAQVKDTPTLPQSSAPLAESWRDDYDENLREWRAQNAEQREKAEKERAKWESIRAKEKEEAAKRKAAGVIDEPTVIPGPPTGTGSWQKVGAGGLSTAASSQLIDLDSEPQAAKTESHATDELHKWEDVDPSVSSIPSLSVDTPPQPSQPQREAPSAQPSVSVTLSIFDTSLSTRTRVLALVSSLAINLALPFVNGVMLGFGEIFAKNVVMGWLGWTTPASNVGLRSGSKDSRQRIFKS